MLKSTTKWLVVAIVVLIITGTALTIWTAERQERSMREQLLIKTSLATVGIVPSEVAALNGSADDLNSPGYQSVKKQLVEYRATDPATRFTYLIGRRPDGMYFFFVDSEPTASADYSPPGQDYPEVTPLVMRVFNTGEKLTDGPASDRWGTWVSGVIPVKDRETGEIIAVFGMDTDARDWYRQVADASIPPAAGTIIILILILTFYAIHLRDERERCGIEESEQIIRESEERYRLLFTRSPIGIVQLDRKGTVVMVNDRYAEIVGASPEQLKDFNAFDQIKDPAFLQAIKEALDGNIGYFEGEYTSVLSGKKMYLRGAAQPLGTGGSSWSGAIGIVEDITDHKKAEEALEQLALQKSEIKYRTLIESANEGIFVIQDGKIPYANPKAHNIIGYDANSLQNMTFDMFVHPDDRESAIKRHLDRLSGKSPESIATMRVIDKQGKLHWIEINAVVIEWEGRPATLNFLTDISIRKKALEELKFRNVILSTQIESTPDGLLIVDEEGNIISYNHCFVTMWNIPSEIITSGSDERVLQSVLSSIVEPDQFLDKVRYLYKNRTEKSDDEILLKDGRIFDRYSSPMIGTDGTYYGRVWYFRDITEKKHAEMKIIESLHEKEILLKEIHHRVKNNLQVVSGLLYLQANQVKDTATKDILASCRNRINSMALLHENLFQVSTFSSVAMAPYIKNLVRYLEESYDTSEWLRFSIDIPDTIYLDIDTGTAVGMITTELITNSIKYAFPLRSSGLIEISLTRDLDGMHFRVSDNGKGLPEGFDPKSSKGLGMKLVTNLARQIQGSFVIQQEGGTTISIVFNSGIIEKESIYRPGNT
jgi:PAS domain S-box-containing protein